MDAIGTQITSEAERSSASVPAPDALSVRDATSCGAARGTLPGMAVMDLVDALRTDVPAGAIVLFGSRARGAAKRYSDHDLGIFQCTPLDFGVYSRLLDRVSAWNEASLITARLVDFTHADLYFLRAVAPDLIFLAGSRTAWWGLLRKAGAHVRA